MQEILKKLLEGNTAQWIEQITSKLGIGGDKAALLVQSLLGKISGLIQGGKIDVSELASGLDPKELLSKIDLGAVASEAGVDEQQARKGAKTILPDLVEKAKGFGDAGGMLNKAKDMLGGLMG